MKLLVLALSLSVFSALAEGQHHEHHNHSKVKDSSKKVSVVLKEDASKSLLTILKANDVLFNALLKDNQEDVEKAAKELTKEISHLKSNALTELKNKTDSLLKVSRAKSKNENISLYGEFTQHLVNLVKKHHSGSNYVVYYCPMVKKHWIQDKRTNDEVKNVFSQDMLACGEKV